MKLKTRAAHKELEYESTRMAACLCAAVDAAKQAEAYAAKKYAGVSASDPVTPNCDPGMFVSQTITTVDPALRFTSDNISSIGLSLYIRRRDESKRPSSDK